MAVRRRLAQRQRRQRFPHRGDGNDFLNGGAGNDVINGVWAPTTSTTFTAHGPGSGAAFQGVTVNLLRHCQRQLGNTDTLTGIENVNGSRSPTASPAMRTTTTWRRRRQRLLTGVPATTPSMACRQRLVERNDGNDSLAGGDGDDYLNGGRATTS